MLILRVIVLSCLIGTVLGVVPLDAQQIELSVDAEAANIRSGPGVNYSVLAAVERGTRLLVLDRSGSWYEIQVPKSVGISAPTAYVHRSTVRVMPSPSEEAPPAEPPAASMLARPQEPFEVQSSEELDTYELQRNWTDSQWREYDRFDKNSLAAAGLEWLVPTLGHAYVDRAGRGLTPALVSAGGLTLAIIGTQVGCSEEFLGSCLDSGNTGVIWVGILTYIGGRIWGIVSATDYAEEYNRELVNRISRR